MSEANALCQAQGGNVPSFHSLAEWVDFNKMRYECQNTFLDPKNRIIQLQKILEDILLWKRLAQRPKLFG